MSLHQTAIPRTRPLIHKTMFSDLYYFDYYVKGARIILI